MARSIFAVLLVTSLAITSTVAIQVSPNSQCASVCQDNADQDKSDAMQSNTLGSDIVCRDNNYATPTGQKFKTCIECLQQSSDKSTSESDLQWFLCRYILAFTFQMLIQSRQLAVCDYQLCVRHSKCNRPHLFAMYNIDILRTFDWLFTGRISLSD